MNRVLVGLAVMLGVGALGVAGFVTVVATRPSHLHVERSLVIKATPADLQVFVTDMHVWQAWSPWKEYDPDAVVTVSEPPSGVGAWYEWRGNDQVGHGKMQVLSAEPQKVTHDLEFYEPWQSKAVITFTFTPQGDATNVVWAMDEDQSFGGKAAGLFMDMDEMLGGDFAKGLAKLQPLAELAATRRVEEASQAAAAEAARAVALEAARLAAEAHALTRP